MAELPLTDAEIIRLRAIVARDMIDSAGAAAKRALVAQAQADLTTAQASMRAAADVLMAPVDASRANLENEIKALGPEPVSRGPQKDQWVSDYKALVAAHDVESEKVLTSQAYLDLVATGDADVAAKEAALAAAESA